MKPRAAVGRLVPAIIGVALVVQHDAAAHTVRVAV